MKNDLVNKLSRIPNTNIYLDLLLAIYGGIFIGYRITKSLYGYIVVVLLIIIISIMLELKELDKV